MAQVEGGKQRSETPRKISNKRRVRPFPAHRDGLSSLAQRGEGNGDWHGHSHPLCPCPGSCPTTPKQSARARAGIWATHGLPWDHTVPGRCSQEPTWDKLQR